ncbi:hypothetical protein [Hymenobacter sp.]|jgi:hypothetical protein|uniref:hypothetical protein n=1 Tax=Hymenobacter sp. TaxID=1898978 RepID=UPI002ED99923
MPEWEGYINKAKHNQKLIAFLEEQGEDGFPDWIVVVMFYVGLHWVSAWLSNQGRPKHAFSSHGDMRNLIHPAPKQNQKSQHSIPVSWKVYNAYDELFDFSITARYEGFLDEQGMREQEMEDIEECKKDLAIIKQFIEGKGISL